MAVLALVSGLAGRARAYRDLVMVQLQCFADESGYNQGPVIVLAGLVADADVWAEFSCRWQEALDLEPRLAYFKMKEAMAPTPRGQFSGWSTEQRDERVILLNKIIRDHAAGSISVAFPRGPYKTLFGGRPVWKNEYLFAMFKFIQIYKVNCEKLGLDRKIDFIFDDQMHAKRRVVEAWDFFRSPGCEDLHVLMGDYPGSKTTVTFSRYREPTCLRGA